MVRFENQKKERKYIKACNKCEMPSLSTFWYLNAGYLRVCCIGFDLLHPSSNFLVLIEIVILCLRGLFLAYAFSLF